MYTIKLFPLYGTRNNNKEILVGVYDTAQEALEVKTTTESPPKYVCGCVNAEGKRLTTTDLRRICGIKLDWEVMFPVFKSLDFENSSIPISDYYGRWRRKCEDTISIGELKRIVVLKADNLSDDIVGWLELDYDSNDKYFSGEFRTNDDRIVICFSEFRKKRHEISSERTT